MLNKLIKHEWKETWRIPTLILVSISLLTAVAALYFSLQPVPTVDIEFNIGKMALFIGYVFLVSTTAMLLTIYLGTRFYKNLYTDEGYLMHTLPVPPWMLLASKALIATAWMYVSSLLSIACIYPVTYLALPKIVYTDPAEMNLIFDYLLHMFGSSPWKVLFFMIPFLFVSSLFSVILLHAAISLGQLVGRHKVLASILCYLGLNTLISGISSVFMLPMITGVVLTQSDASPEQMMTLVIPELLTSAYVVTFLVQLVLAAAGFFLCNYILRKCLNLD